MYWFPNVFFKGLIYRGLQFGLFHLLWWLRALLFQSFIGFQGDKHPYRATGFRLDSTFTKKGFYSHRKPLKSMFFLESSHFCSLRKIESSLENQEMSRAWKVRTREASSTGVYERTLEKLERSLRGASFHTCFVRNPKVEKNTHTYTQTQTPFPVS